MVLCTRMTTLEIGHVVSNTRGAHRASVVGDQPNYRCALTSNATLNETIPYQCDSIAQCGYAQCEMYRYMYLMFTPSKTIKLCIHVHVHVCESR